MYNLYITKDNCILESTSEATQSSLAAILTPSAGLSPNGYIFNLNKEGTDIQS